MYQLGITKQLKRKHLLIIIAVVVVIAAVIFGVVAYVNRRSATDAVAGGAPAVAEPTTREQLSANLYDFTNRFYAEYTATPADGSSVQDQRTLALNGFGSPAAINSFASEEKQCTQNIPSSVTVDGVTEISSPYKVGVTYHYSDGSDQQFNVTVIEENKAYLIDGIACS